MTSALTILSALAAIASAFTLFKLSGGRTGGDHAKETLRKCALGVLAVSGPALLILLSVSGAISLRSSLTLLALAASVWGIAKCSDAGSMKAKLMASALFLISLCLTALLLWQSGVFGERQTRPELNLDKFECARAYIFAKRLAEMHPGAKALLVTGWTSESEPLVKAQLEEIKKGFGDAIEIKAQETVPVERRRDKLPRWGFPRKYDTKDFNGMLAKHKDCSLLVSTVGLPPNLRGLSIWKMKEGERPFIALLDCDLPPLGNAIRSGYISLVSAYRKGWTYSPETPANPQEAFDKRYILITKDNVEAVAKSFGSLR